MEQKNDWLATLFLNPDKGTENFIAAGLNSSNTVMYNKDYYQNIDQIKQKFSDAEGNFDQEAFDQYYDSAVRTYNKFVNNDLNNKNVRENDWSLFSIEGKGQGKLPVFGITKVANPELRTSGISSLYGQGEARRSMKEAAQDNFARDADGNKLDWRPNDDNRRGLSFFKNKPLYYAKWDEDGTHLDANGNEVYHLKGEYKLDEEGMPFVQELGEGEDVSGKELVSITDTLTIDGSQANKFDFFDSDGIDKSVAGSVAKMVATIAPLFIPYVGEVYAYGLIAANAADALSSISKVGIETLDKNYKDNDLWKLLNNTEAYTKSFVTQRSISQKGQESFWNFENLVGMVGDVTQGAQQRAVAKGAINFMRIIGYDRTGMNLQKKLISEYGDTYLKKYGKSLQQAFIDGDVADDFLTMPQIKKMLDARKAADKFARSSSSWYMALTQSSDIVDSMKENDFSSPYTAAATLAALLGFKKIMDSELGDVALKGLGLDEVSKAVKKNLKQLANEGQASFDAAKTQTGKLAWIRQTADKISNRVQKLMESSEFMESALKEGAEEVSEEVLQDIIMQGSSSIAWSLKQLGIDQTNKGSWNYLDSNPLERYLSAFVGGAIGGPVNRALDIAQNWKAYQRHKAELAKSNKSDVLDFVDLVRKYGKEPILKELDKYEKKGMFPTGLSLNSLGNDNFQPAMDYSDSQNAILFDYLKQYVEYWDTLIHEEGLSISDSDLINEAMNKDIRVAALRENGLGSEVINTFNNLLVQLANANLRYKELYYSIRDDQKANSSELAEAKKTADDIRQKIKDLREGLYADDFLDKTVFKLSRSLGASLYTPDIYMYARSINKDYSEADENTRKEIEESYQEFTKNNSNVENLAYEVFKRSRDLVQGDIMNVKELDVNYLKDLQESLHKLFIDSKIDGLEPPTQKEIDDLKKEKKNGRSNDEIISLYGLNQKQDALTEEQKESLVDDYFNKEIENEWNSKSSDAFIKYFQLGLDPKFFGDTQRLGQVINVLGEIKNKYGYIDAETANKVKLIIDKLNIKDFSTETIVKNFVNSGESLSYEFEDASSILSTIKPIVEKLEVDEETMVEMQELGGDRTPNGIELKKLDEQNYEATLTNNLGEEYTVVLNNTTVTNLLRDLLSVDTSVQSLLDYNNSKNSLIEQLRKISIPDATAVSLIEQANKLLDSSNVKDISSQLLGKISSAVYGEDITELYKQLLNSLTSSKSLVDFIISDPSAESRLDILINSVNLLASILTYSTEYKRGTSNPNLFDFITVVNGYRRNKGLEELQTLSVDGAEQIKNQLGEIANAANIMKEISAINRNGKIKENKIIHTKIVANWIRIFSTHKGIQSILLDGNKFFDLEDIEPEALEATVKASLGQELSVNEVTSLEKELLRMETYYYNKFQNLSDSQKSELVQELSKLNPYGSLPAKLNRDFDIASIDNESVVAYVLSTLVYDPNDFRNNYIQSISDDSFKDIVPLYPQMLVVKEAVSAFFGANTVNEYLGDVVTRFPDKSREIYLRNQTLVSGSAGSGKTKVVAKLFKNIITLQDPNIKFSSYALKQDRANELHKTIESEEVFSGYELYSKWFSQDVINEIKSFKESLLGDSKVEVDNIIKKKNEILEKLDKNKLSPNREVLIIDEYTHLSNFELMILGGIPNLYILNLGDPKQNGFNGIMGSGGSLTAFSTPSLDVSIRANNNHKKDNLNSLASIIDSLQRQNELYKTGQAGISNTASTLDLIKKDGFFKFSESNGLVRGEQTVSSVPTISELESMITSLPNGENIAYIYDKAHTPTSEMSELTSKYPGKFITVHKDDVQGSEYNYTIVDIDYKEVNKADTPATVVNALRDLYTLMSRSKDGTILISNSHILLGNSRRYKTYSSSTFDPKEVSDYKEFISSVYKGLELNSSTSVKPSKPEPTPEIGTPGLKSSTPGSEVLKQVAEKDIKESKELDNPGAFTVFQSHIMYNFNTGSNRNLGKWDRDKDIISKFNILKNLIFRNQEDLERILSNENTDRYQNSLLTSAISLFPKFGITSRTEAIEAIRESEFFIQKVQYSDEYASEDNGVNSNIEAPDYIYRIFRKIGDWEIDLGVITDPNKLVDRDIRTKLITANTNQSFKLDKSKMNIQFSKAKITLVKEGKFTFDNNSISKFSKNNPWANISGKIWVANKETKANYIQAGYPFVLYSRDLFINPDEFKSLFEKRISGENNNIVPLRASLHGYDFTSYMKKWGTLYNSKNGKRVIKFTSFSGYRQPILLRRQLIRFQRYLTARAENQNIETALKDLYAGNATALNNDIEYYNGIVSPDQLQSVKKTIDTLISEWSDAIAHFSNNFKVDWERLDRSTFRKDTKTLLDNLPKNKIVEQIRNLDRDKLTEKLTSIFGDKANKAMVDGVYSDLEAFLKLYDAFTKLAEDNPNILSTLTPATSEGVNEYTNISGDLIDWLINKGYAANFIGGTMLTHSLFKIVNKSPELMNAASIGIDHTAQYKDGIWANGIFSDMSENGFYRSSNTTDDLYFNSLIEIPNAYIDLSSIQFGNNTPVETSEEISEETTENTLNSYLDKLNLHNSTVDLANLKSKIEELYNNRKDKNLGIVASIDGEIIPVDGKAIMLRIKDESIEAEELGNNNAIELLKSKAFEILEDDTIKENLKVLLGNNIPVQILVNGNEIQFNFTDEFFTLNGSTLEKVEQLETVVQSSNEFMETLQNVLDTEGVGINLSNDLDSADLDAIKGVIEIFKDQEVIEAVDIRNSLKPNYKNVNKNLPIKALTNYILQALNSNKQTNQCSNG